MFSRIRREFSFFQTHSKMEVREKFLKEAPRFNERYENRFLSFMEKVKLNLPLHKRKISFYFFMVGFSYCFPVYQQLAIFFEKKDIWIKKALWFALGLEWKQPQSIEEANRSELQAATFADPEALSILEKTY